MTQKQTSREEFHQRLDQVLDTLENIATDNNSDVDMDQAARNEFWSFVSAVSLGVIGRDLHEETLDQINADPVVASTPEGWEATKQEYHIALTARLLHDLSVFDRDGKPQTDLFDSRYVIAAVIDDLQHMLDPNGSKPGVLAASTNNSFQRKGDWRRSFVLGVEYRSEKDGVSVAEVLRRLSDPVEKPLWDKWKTEVSNKQIQIVRAEAKTGEYRPFTEDEHLKKLAAASYGKELGTSMTPPE